MSFETLGLAPTLLSAVQKAGFTEPTSVQAAAIPQALAGQDLMVSSQTGSGKTAAFMLPALHRIAQMPANKGAGVQVLVLTPTRELAMQVADATKLYGAHLKDLRIATVVGGMPYGAQLKALSRRVDVLVATPGRLIDHLQAKRVNLSTVHTLVLDEADRMLDMGFIEDIETIVSRTPESRQTLLFSATLDGTIARLAAEMLRDPQRIVISTQKQKHTNITQSLLYADDNAHKMRLLDHLLRDVNLDQAIVFTSTKRGADDLADRLSEQGFAAAALHGDMNQRQRTRTLGLLQKGRLQVLVATDVAARGIDVQGISHAVNYDLPLQAEDYVHRIGRTGRAGRSGLAFTLATHSERHKVRRIEHFLGQPIPPEVIAGLEPKQTARPFRGERKGPGKGFSGRGYQGRPEGRGFKPHGDRPSYGQRASSDERPGFKDRAAFGDRPSYRDGASARPASAEQRPSYRDRGGYEERPSFQDRAPSGRPAFKERSSFEDRNASGDRRKPNEGGFRHGKPKTGGRPSTRPGFAPKGGQGAGRRAGY